MISLQCQGQMRGAICGFLIEMIEDHSLYAELGKVLSVGQKFSYRYDFGSSTNLNLRIVSEREGLVNPKDAVMLLARNLALEFKCSVCGAPATLIFGGAWGDGNAYCKKHAKKYEGEGCCCPLSIRQE